MAVGFKSNSKTVLSMLAAAVAAVGGIRGASAAFIDGNWNVNAAGNWSTATNWSSNPFTPGGPGATVGLNFAISANRIVTIDTTSQTVGTLNTGDTDLTPNSYTLAASGGATLILDNAGPSAAINQLSTSNGDTISAPILLNASLTISNASATKGLILSGGTSSGTAGLKTITNSGSGGGAVTFQTATISDGAGSIAFVQNSVTSQLTLNVASAYTGGVTDLAGTVWAHNATSLGTGTFILGDTGGFSNAALLASTGSNSTINVANNINVRAGTSGTLTIYTDNTNSNDGSTLSGNITLDHDLVLRTAASGAGSITLSGAITGTQPAMITFNQGSAAATISGVLGANVTAIVQDNPVGTLTLSGTSPAFTGDLQIKQSTMIIGQLSQGTSNVAYVNLGATLQKSNAGGSSTGRSAVAGLMDGANGGGTVTRSTGGGSRPLEIGGTGIYSFSGILQDNTAANPFLLIKTGTGSQTLSGSSTYTGGTTVLNGTLTLNANTGSLASTGNLTMQGGTFAYDNTASSGAKSQGLGALSFAAGGSALQSVQGGASSATLTFGSLANRGSGATGNFVYTGGTIGASNNIVLIGTAQGFVNQGLFVNGADYAFMDTAGGFVRPAVYGTDSGFVNAGAALTTASHNHVTSSITSQATETVNTIKFDGSGAVDLAMASNANLVLSNGGLLRAGGGSTSISGSGTSGISTVADGEYVFRTDSAADSLSVGVPITANNNLTGNRLVKDGAGTLTLGAANTYTAATYVNGGILSISSNANLGVQAPTAAAVNLNNGTLQATATFGLYNGAPGTNNRNIVIFNNGTVDVTGTNTLTVAGVVSDDWTAISNSSFHKGSLTKTNTGTLELTGANTYQGGTTVSNGKLLANNTTGSATGTGAVTVGGTGTLGGSGFITGPVSVTSGGTLSPGNSPGVLTVGGLSMAPSSTYAVDLNGLTVGTQYDQVIVTAGTPSLGGATLSISSTGYAPTAGGSDEFVILDNQTANAISGTFAALAQDSVATTIGGETFKITYTGDTSSLALIGGNDVILYQATGVPEPSSLGLAALGAVALLRRRRR